MHSRWVLLALLAAAAPCSAQSNCSAIAAATVAEMRAAAGEDWNPQLASMLRQAAASACVKSDSGRYVDVQEPGDSESIAVQSTAVPATPAAPAAPEAGVAPEAVDSAEDDEGISIAPLSGSPTSKPYMRKRRKRDN